MSGPGNADFACVGSRAGDHWDGNANDAPAKWHVSILGGLKRRGHWHVGARNIVVTAFGGADLDMTQADFVGPDVSLVLISILGVADIRVPATVRVEQRVHALRRPKGRRPRTGGGESHPAPQGPRLLGRRASASGVSAVLPVHDVV